MKEGEKNNMSIGKVNKNGTFNNGAFYSIPEVNTLVNFKESEEKINYA